MELAYFLCIEVPACGMKGLSQHLRGRRRLETTPTLNLRQNVPSQLEHYIMQLKAEQAAAPTTQQATGQFQRWQRQTFAHKHVISK